jgi:FKBP-type peptidyl-prolyl cis-trans isomerase FkpA
MRLLLAVLLPAALLAQAPNPAPTPTPQAHMALSASPQLATDDQKTIYSLGLFIYRSLAQFDLSPAEVELVKQGLSAAAAGKPGTDINVWGPKIKALAQARTSRAADREKTASAAFLEKAAAEPGAEKTASGLIYRTVKAGTGASPAKTDTVKVNYRGTLTNGTEFDSSYARNQPAQFPLNGVIPCWTEGLQKIKVGGKAVLTCPSSIAYGDRGQPPTIPGGATLVFEVELLDIVAAPAPAPAPTPAPVPLSTK